MRMAHVARAMMRMRPTRDAAVMTPTDRALFCRKDLGVESACADADAGAVDEVSLALVVSVTVFVGVVGVDVAEVVGGVTVAVSLVEGREDVVGREEVVLGMLEVVMALEDVVLYTRLNVHTKSGKRLPTGYWTTLHW